jgi:hypothetical protein
VRRRRHHRGGDGEDEQERRGGVMLHRTVCLYLTLRRESWISAALYAEKLDAAFKERRNLLSDSVRRKVCHIYLEN